jgi:cytochrome c oxidase subunit 3
VFFAAFLGIWATSYAAVRTWPPAGLAGPGLVVPTIGVVLLAIGYADIPFGVGQGIYESLFYMIIGLELAHVVGGAVLLTVVLVRASTGELALRRDPVQSAAIYWYFVVGLGVVIYAVLYLGAIR